MLKILVVDDSIFERKIIIDTLKMLGYNNVIEAGCGEEAINLYKKEHPDLILLDLRMPGPSGEEVLLKLKEMDPNIKVAILSIVRDEDTIKELLDLGALTYITKPITKEKIKEILKKYWEVEKNG